MNFFNDEIHQDMVDMYRDFAQNSCLPIAAELDEQERFPEENIPIMAEMGLLGIPFPEEYGGAGLDEVSYAQCVEEISKVCASTGVTISAHTSLGTWPIYKFGTEAQKQKYLPDLCSGKKLGAFGLTEPDAGTDAAGQKTVFEDKGDYYLVNGSKIFITNAAYADVFIVFGMTDKSQGTKGISAFIVEKGTPGFSTTGHEKKMGIRGSSTSELVFDDCRIPKENLLGEIGKGFKVAMTTLDGGRIGIVAQAVGIAQRAITDTVKYDKQRIQFGKPIWKFQNTQFQLADMQTKVDAARLLLYRAAQAKQDGEPHSHLAAMAKLFASETASDVTRRCLQLIGGFGYTRDYPFERYMRDAKITEIYEGTSEVQRMVISGWLGATIEP
jgi:butyryl-CoA dehydrogenase